MKVIPINGIYDHWFSLMHYFHLTDKEIEQTLSDDANIVYNEALNKPFVDKNTNELSTKFKSIQDLIVAVKETQSRNVLLLNDKSLHSNVRKLGEMHQRLLVLVLKKLEGIS